MNRIKSLDGARGIAALLVVLDHYVTALIEAPIDSVAYYIASFIGSYAVGLFFITSGFVVAASATVSSGSDFFVKRIFRLYPIAIAAVALRILSEYLIDSPRNLDFENFLLSVSLFGSDVLPNEFLVEPIFWTLAIEVKFYLLIGFAYFFARAFKADLYSIALITLIFLAVGRVHIIPHHPMHQWATNFGVLASTLPMLILGWIFWLFHSNQISLQKLIAGLVGILLVFSIAPFPIYVSLDKGTPSWLLAFATFCYLIYFQNHCAFLYNKIFQLLGRLSYSLYACHMAVAVLIKHFSPENNLITFIVFISVSLIVSYGVHVLIETPMVRFSKSLMKPKKVKLTSTEENQKLQ
ncbi:acyltransferase [Pseudomonas sp. Irchel s3a12]|uniref:acyltransferase family protein n=1 Tax=Pseudomonas sp. Irchel s3a12 TaxID=2009047 RepID=UPI000BA33820|nr:acyltransferase [Pseudomonas sp. Irchel s3a12]